MTPTIDALTAVGRDVAADVRAVYVHVPFCFHKCHYCDFYSFVDSQDRQPAYAARLRDEIDAARSLLARPVDSIFVGGGTPTFLRPPVLRDALGAIAAGVARTPGAEWTVEANPETVTDEVAGILVEFGVNRVSLGAQSFHVAHLKTLERWHDPASVARAVTALRRAGIRRINLDLIFGIPGETLDDWTSDVERALDFEIVHLSCYGLTYEPNTAMSKRLERGHFEPCDEALEAAMYERTMDLLERRGFEHYEISNWAKPGEACRHNLAYWRNLDWWALGPSASGHVGGTRFKNVPRISEWLASAGASPVVDVERVDEDRRFGELLMLGLRLCEGMDAAQVERCCATSSGDERRAAIARHETGGLLERVGGRVRLTRRGKLLADEVLADLV
ncbi:MAG: radical SAM family heme chaperone HemW [Phycisphaerales bacterium]